MLGLQKLFSLTLLCLMLAVPQTFAKNEVLAKAHLTTHQIVMETIMDNAVCSATAIGKYAILTAAHCEEATDKMMIDDQPAFVVGIIRDGVDHTIFLVNMEKPFPAWAVVADALPEIGQEVFMFGNPGEMADVFRRGYVTDIRHTQPSLTDLLSGAVMPVLVHYDMNSFSGDSGAALFDAATGEITGVVTGTLRQGDPAKGTFALLGAFPLAFSQADLKKAASFSPGPAK